MTGVPIKRGNGTKGQTQGEHLVKIKAEWGGCFRKPRNTKDCQKPPETREEAWDRFFLTPSEGTDPADAFILDFQPLEL